MPVMLHLGRDALRADDCEPECGPFARSAIDADLAAHCFGELLADGETKAGTTVFSGDR